MSLTFISNITETSTQEQINSLCKQIWEIKKDTAIKLFFFIRDKDQGKNQINSFVKIMTWLFLNHPTKFYDNFSLIVGIPNSNTSKSINAKNLLNQEYKKHEEILDYFVDNDFKDSFRKNWVDTVNYELINMYKLPVFGTFEDLIAIAENIRLTKSWSYDVFRTEKLYYYVITIFCNKIKQSNSSALTAILKYPEYKIENYVDITKPSNLCSNVCSNFGSKKDPTHKTFLDRYRFVL